MAFFENTRPGQKVTYNEATFDLPILYFRDDFFGLYFMADFKKVRAIMPSSRLYPLMLPNGRAVIAVAAYNYRDTTIGPYGEVPVVIPVTFDDPKGRFSSLKPLLMESNYPGFGLLVQHLPVTKITARDAGRGQWGYTKFVADMEFRVTPEYFKCSIHEDKEFILDMTVPKKGFGLTDTKPLTTYSVKDGQLIKTVIKQRGIKHLSFFPQEAGVNFGFHPMAQSIRDLGIAKKPFMSMYYTQRSGILPAGSVMEENVRPFQGYLGKNRNGVHETFYTDYDV